MTSEMAFECLLVSNDPSLFSVVSGILRDLSVTLDICLRASSAAQHLEKGGVDLIVIDWRDREAANLLDYLRKEWEARKPTILAVSSPARPATGAHFVLKRPFSSESCKATLNAAYYRMLLDYRKHVRHALMLPVLATCEDGREVLLTITDIGDGGVGLCTREKLITGDVLSFHLLLPGAPKEIAFQVRVLWTREYSRAGGEFVRIPPVDLVILHDWLRSKAKVKKPLTEI
jgi:PilZ domain